MLSKTGHIFLEALKKFVRIDGSQRAAAFAFYALFSMCPAILLIVAAASTFIDRNTAGEVVVSYFRSFIPINEEIKEKILLTFVTISESRRQAGVTASVVLIWAALQFFSTLIRSTNRAWGIEIRAWYHLPLISLLLLTIMSSAVFVGILFPILLRMTEEWLFSAPGILSRAYETGSLLIPPLFIFLSLMVFYKIAPRRLIRFSEVWIPALVTTVLFRTGDLLFVVYLKRFAPRNAVYGAFGGASALLMWSFLTGCIFIFGACLCAAVKEIREMRGLPR